MAEPEFLPGLEKLYLKHCVEGFINLSGLNVHKVDITYEESISANPLPDVIEELLIRKEKLSGEINETLSWISLIKMIRSLHLYSRLRVLNLEIAQYKFDKSDSFAREHRQHFNLGASQYLIGKHAFPAQLRHLRIEGNHGGIRHKVKSHIRLFCT